MSIVEALLEERRGYLARGLKDRVAAVDAELKRHGIAVDSKPVRETASVEPDVEQASAPKPSRRRV